MQVKGHASQAISAMLDELGPNSCDAKRPLQAQEQSTHYHGEGLSGDLPVDDSLTHVPASQSRNSVMLNKCHPDSLRCRSGCHRQQNQDPLLKGTLWCNWPATQEADGMEPISQCLCAYLGGPLGRCIGAVARGATAVGGDDVWHGGMQTCQHILCA